MTTENLPRVVLLGHSGVGKTSLCQQYVSHQIEANHIPTIGSQEYITRVFHLGRSHKVVVEDSQGSNTTSYAEIVHHHHRLSLQSKEDLLQEKTPLLQPRDPTKTGFIVCYDGTNPKTLAHALEVVDCIYSTYNYDPKRQDGHPPVSVFLLRNKCDLRSRFPFDPNICEGTKKGHVQHFETSAKFNEKVIEVFRQMFAILLDPNSHLLKSPKATDAPIEDSPQSCRSPCVIL